MRRIEIVEEAIDSNVQRMDKFMTQAQLDLSRQDKFENALKD